MKKLILTLLLSFTALSLYAADNKKLAEVIAAEYDSTILEVQQNDLKAGDSIILEPAIDSECIVTAVDGNIVILSAKNNGFAPESNVLIKNAEKFGNLNAVKAVVKAVKVNSIILDVKKNTFKVQDRVTLTADGKNNAVVKMVDGNIVILSLKDAGYSEGSKVFVKKGREKFEERKRK